jgi:four helix bundle protein
MERRNKNRGYKQLIVWQDAVELYGLNWQAFKRFPYEFKRVAGQQIASVDSVHRNIAEGYCRRTIREYLQALNIALGSLGESVSALHTYHKAGQLDDATFESLDALAYKLENGLLRLVESLERKKEAGDWIETLVVKESNAAYLAASSPLQDSIAPSLHPSSTPILHSSTTPPVRYTTRKRSRYV